MTVGSTQSSSRGIGKYVGRVLALALAAGALAVTQAAAPAFAADAVAGGQTASPPDTLFPDQGNSGYDVSHYDINFRVDIGVSSTNNAASTTTLSDSTTTITASTTGAPLKSFSFDFQGSTSTLANSTYNVDGVTVNGAPATFTRIENTVGGSASSGGSAVGDVHKLIVTPSVPVDGTFTTVVTTSGRPVIHTDTDDSLEGWNNTVDGATFVNQPIGAMTLFPNNNTPRDKATYTWTVNAPTKSGTSNFSQAGGKPYPVGVVSNGELVSQTPSGDGSRTTWVWDQKVQQASELSFFSVGRYDIYHSNITLASGRTIPEWTFIDPAIPVANQTTTLSTRAQLKQMLDFYESRYGPYPGNSTGLVTDNTTGINYALETQDRPYSPNSASRGTTYHEIMHQWFGDNVSPKDWNDIWLNEGPATFSETQFPYEGAGSSTTPGETSVFNSYNNSAGTSSLWQTPVAAMTNAEDLFGSPTYTRGNMTLYALRTAIGTDKFATLMKTWQTTYGGTSRTTADFIALAESISGFDLTTFFDNWVYTTGKPAWPVRFNLNVAGPTTTVNAGDAVTYTLSARNTGKVAMPAGGSTVSLDISDLLDNATVGTLPSGVTQDGNTLTWSVPATALAATSSVDVPFTVKAATTGTLKTVASATTLGGNCVSCTSSVVIGSAPISPAPVPTITGLTAGAPVVGQTLTADTTGWAAGTSFGYQWYIDGTPVSGATSASYTPTMDAVGFAVTVQATGTLAGFNATSATSAATAVGVRATQMTGTLPTISGTPKIAGSQLTVDPGTWEPGTVFTYQWRANGTNISGATGPAYIPTLASQVGQTLDVVVAGTKAGYTTTTKTSAVTAPVAASDTTTLTATPTPTFTGTPKVGAPFTPSYGLWDDGVVLTYQWAANGTNVSGSTGTGGSITPTAAQLGQTLVLTVTGSKAGATPVTKTTTVSDPVGTGTQVLQPTPTISVPARANSAVTATPGAWDSGTTRTYQWLLDGAAVDGATTTSFTPSLDQVGKVLTFQVTSTKPAFDTVVKTSDPTTIRAMAQVLTPKPTINGTPQVGVQLTAVPGTWDDGTTLAYQWYADAVAIPSATSATYTPTPSTVGAAITVAVTGSKPDYETVTSTSDATTVVEKGELGATPVPTITGTPKVGVTLTAVPGTWDSGTTLAYQWKADGDAIGGATGTTYTPGAGVFGKAISVTVTGTKTGYTTASKTSAATAAVAAGDLSSTPVPVVTGKPKVGVQLTAVTGTWDSGTTLAYQWLADGTPIDGATSATFTPGADLTGAHISVTVTGTKTGYSTVSRTSTLTAGVADGDLEATPVPTITGTPEVDVELTAVPGTWDDGTTLGYQWFADGAAIEGATGTTYVATVADLGKQLSVAVTGTKSGYATVTRTSEPTNGVGVGHLVATPTPTIAGTPKVGTALKAVAGTWDDGTTLTYRWLRHGSAIPGAVGSTYTPVAADVGAPITVEVTGTKAGYSQVSTVSARTRVVVRGTLATHPLPVVTGTAKVGRILKVRPVRWETGVKLTYRWYAGSAPIRGATKAQLKVTKKMAGKQLHVVVTATKAGYTTVVKSSKKTAKVKA